jgi:hypothetical protein
VAMHRDCMLNGGLDELLLSIGGDRNSAVHIARILTAVNKHPWHRRLPKWSTKFDWHQNWSALARIQWPNHPALLAVAASGNLYACARPVDAREVVAAAVANGTYTYEDEMMFTGTVRQ